MSNTNILPAEKVVIDGKELHRIEYKGQRVITTKEISDHHELDVRVINQKYRRNKSKFVEGVDYFEVPMDEVRRSQLVTASKYDNSDYLLLITESGYLKFVKTINDDKAWKIYTHLINCYFAVKRLNGIEQEFISHNKENRKGLASEWAKHSATDYRGLTLTEYATLFDDINIRKAKMDKDQITILSIFEACESIKLRNNPDIKGNTKLKESITSTGNQISNIVKPQINNNK